MKFVPEEILKSPNMILDLKTPMKVTTESILNQPTSPPLALNVANKILVFVIAIIYSRVMKGLGLAICLTHMITTVQYNEE